MIIASAANMEYMSSLQNDLDILKPSLFEILSEEQLSALIPPSLRYLLVVATHRRPRYLLRILNSFDEVYALLSLIVEGYYLRVFGGSFTEHFYSLKRERVLCTKNGEIPRSQLGSPGQVRETLRLRTSDVWKNLAVIVGLPYLKRKLDESYDIHSAPQASLIMGGGPRYRPSDDELPPNPSLRKRLLHYYKWFLRNAYPSVNAAYYFSILAFNLAYLFDNTKYSSPLLWLVGTRIRRLGLADHRAMAMAMAAEKGPSGRNTRSRPGSNFLGRLSLQSLYPQVFSSLRFLLPASIFALKFFEWWHASNFSRQLARKVTETLHLPAPLVAGMVDPSKKTPSPTTRVPSSSTDQKRTADETDVRRKQEPPISSTSFLPIFTVPLPTADPSNDDNAPCPICLNPLMNPTACQTGYVFCYSCIFRWLNGEHERQLNFMTGEGGSAAWEDEYGYEDGQDTGLTGHGGAGSRLAIEKGIAGEPPPTGRNNNDNTREGKWESGKGRCPITGRRVLGGTEGLRRVLV
ncbi:Pex2 / Pex12 amino terminal region domain containing protein [Elaphomyces granulatus]